MSVVVRVCEIWRPSKVGSCFGECCWLNRIYSRAKAVTGFC